MAQTASRDSARRRYYARYLAQYTKKNTSVLVLGGLFVAGALLGTLLLRGAGAETLDFLERLVGGYVTQRRHAGLYENFASGAGSSMLFVGVMFVCGFCAIAQPIIMIAPFIRGLGFGFSAASLFARYGASATGQVGVLLLPGMLVSTVAILLCCRQALRLSCAFFGSIRQNSSKTGEGYSLKKYCLWFLLATLICLAGALLEAVLYYVFANSFILG